MTTTMTLEEAAHAEIRARHDFFVAWFTGQGTDGGMRATRRAFHPDMRRIGPDGAFEDRDTVIAALTAASGKLSDAFRIVIEPGDTVWHGTDTVLVTYIERQDHGTTRTARRSAALLTRDPAAPHGVVWRFVQETWIPAAGPDADRDPAPTGEAHS
ncbi:MAG: hypothetical protein ACTS3R_19600 [Inquilinaceae bacterium]